ncbi:DEAD/DEAH box helicase [Candidatus Microgenomates bacterium]|nr:DEAD/DEAH box helicase [Candidatus Microgenomates bacterium]
MYKSNGGSRGGSKFSFSKGSRFAPRKNFHGGRYSSRSGVNDVSKYVRGAEAAPTEEAVKASMLFSDMPLSDIVKAAIVRRGFEHPTPIQEQAIPHIMEGKDVIGIANTGTGKTGAFLLPLLEKILKDRNQKVLIVVPTRELGTQIRDELREFSNNMGIYSSLVIGGANMHAQITQIRRNPHFVIGTPGRLKDLIERRVLNLSNFHNVVLDEVDRMVDMGFIQDIRHLISLLPKERQSLFFSATISPQINSIIQTFLMNPVTVSVRTRETSKNVHQNVVKVEPGSTKIRTLEGLLEKEELKKVLIFGRTKHGVERLSGHL